MCNDKRVDSAPTTAKRKVKNDIIFISVLLLIILSVALALFLFRTVGDTVVVTIDGKIFAEYSLGEDREVQINSGDGYNLLVIEGGEAYIKKASCPDGICSSHRAIKHDGESIICLPNKVVVEIRTQGEKQPDIIA